MSARSAPLKRILGVPTAILLGMGVAIGSGIFRTPGAVAENLPEAGWMLAAWVAAGIFMLGAGLVTAELATRYPRAGGEYVYLREAYGPCTAFLFGWVFTIFVVGGSVALIGAAFGDFAVELFDVPTKHGGLFAAGAVAAAIAVNSAGLRVGAGVQNLMTTLKIVALLAVVGVGFWVTRTPLESMQQVATQVDRSMWMAFVAGFLPALWAYAGSTDIAMMAEEIKDSRRALPRALVVSSVAMIGIYVVTVLALLRVVPADEMVGLASVHGEAMRRVFGPTGQKVMLAVGMLVCFGSMLSALMATIRVTFALARDGLAFRSFAKMSDTQAPVTALVTVGAFAMVLALSRTFREVLSIYFFASAILFAMSYATLIVFRLRDTSFPDNIFRCPLGIPVALCLIGIEMAIAYSTYHSNPQDTVYCVGIMVFLALVYWLFVRQNFDTKRHNDG